MKLVMTLRTRDQADIVEAVVAFHLNAGVDFVIATDHRSVDGTVEILESYAREGVLRLIRELGEDVRGSKWRTRMARLAATEHGADWVLLSVGRGPCPERRRSRQMRACSNALNSLGERCGGLERSRRQASVRRSSSLASRQRCHQLQAVAGETPWRLAASRIEQPPSIARTSA